MPGRPDWQNLVAIEQPTFATINQTPTTDIAAGTHESITVYAASGSVSYFNNANCEVPAPTGATAGEHSLLIGYGSFGSFTLGQSAWNNLLVFQYGFWVDATQTQYPPATSDQAWWLHGQTGFDSITGFEILYATNTTAGTELASQGRFYYFSVVVVG